MAGASVTVKRKRQDDLRQDPNTDNLSTITICDMRESSEIPVPRVWSELKLPQRCLGTTMQKVPPLSLFQAP